jgi:predicted permease
LPGVFAASTTCCVPLELVWQLPFKIDGRTNDKVQVAEWTFISPEYFDVFKIPIVRGRDFTDGDNAASPGVVIINQTMARMYWPNGDPLNDSLIIGRGVRPDYLEDPIRRIVGIVGDVRDQTLERNPRPAMYVPVGQAPDGVTTLNVRLLPLTWVVRTHAEPHALTSAIEKELNEASSGLPVGRVRSMDEIHMESTARNRFLMWLMTSFGFTALILAVVGVYSVTAYSVQQRTPEIGVRLSLGATPNAVRNMVVFQAFGLGILGIALGNAGALLLSRFFRGVLYGVTATDPTTFLAASLVLSVTVLAAVSIPARLATRVSPSIALRYE